jgi:4-hydroxy-4-methyl-2-oxoglutarate aldolase
VSDAEVSRLGRMGSDDLDRLAAVSYSAVWSDIADALGLHSQSVASGLHRFSGPDVLVGWARTASFVAVEVPPVHAYANEMKFVDSLQEGDVVVAVCSDHVAAVWGELFSAAAIARGARGVIVDGMVRDRRRLPDGFSVLAKGSVPAESHGRLSLIAADDTLTMGGVTVSAGDLVIGDADGVVVVPAALADVATERALQKALTERSALSTLRAGGYLREVWDQYGVL